MPTLGTGTAVYYPTQQGTAKDGKTRPESCRFDSVVKTLAPRFHTGYANALQGLLKDKGLLSDLRTNIGGKQGALTGSIYSEVPVVLVELCVLTNPHDEAIVSSDAGQQKLAEALLAGVLQVFLKSTV